MSETADEAAQPESARPVNPGWFGQIPFDPRKGLDSVLPMKLPPLLPSQLAAEHDEV